MRRLTRGALLALGAISSIAAGPRDTLSRARQMYNLEQYDAAIVAAREASLTPQLSDVARLVLARAYLERFRRGGDTADLSAARETLKEIRVALLAPDDRLDLTIALGESLFFDDRAGAAAEQFELALARPDPKDLARHDRILDWWAGALDRQAQLASEPDARVIHARIIKRMEDELGRDDGSTVASYWLVAAARSSGDLDRAWDAAMAAWVRASLAGRGGPVLRADLDRLVLQAIVPERARQSAPADPQIAAASMRQQWETLKQDWAVS